LSLVSLTFGERRNNFSRYSEIEVLTPADCIKIDPNVENRLEVVKSCFFFKHNEPYIVGNIVSGVVAENMRGKLNGKEFEIVEVNSKYGCIGKKGMTIGLMVKGLTNEQIAKGATITFEPLNGVQ